MRAEPIQGPLVLASGPFCCAHRVSCDDVDRLPCRMARRLHSYPRRRETFLGTAEERRPRHMSCLNRIAMANKHKSPAKGKNKTWGSKRTANPPRPHGEQP